MSLARKFTITTSKSNILERTIVSGAISQEMRKRLASSIEFYVDFSSYIMMAQRRICLRRDITVDTDDTNIAKF